MARLHEALAMELLNADSPKGWLHLFAAITAWVKAGNTKDYRKGVTLLVHGLERVLADYPKQHPHLAQISDLMAWMTRRQRADKRLQEKRAPRAVEDPAPAPARAPEKRRAVA